MMSRISWLREAFSDIPGKMYAQKVLGCIFNSGNEPLYIRFTWGKTVELTPNTELEVSMNNVNAFPDSELKSTGDLYEAQVIDSSQIIFKDNGFPS